MEEARAEVWREETCLGRGWREEGRCSRRNGGVNVISRRGTSSPKAMDTLITDPLDYRRFERTKDFKKIKESRKYK